MLRNTITKLIYFILIVAISVIFDQFTKLMALLYLKGNDAYPVIENILEFLYSENRGAAFGIMQGFHGVFFVITAIVCVAIVYFIWKLPMRTRFMPLYLCLIFIFSGAIGNFIDRIYRGYVVDFIYFKPINFPVFNVADMYVSISTFVLMFLLLFIYKDDELQFMKVF